MVLFSYVAVLVLSGFVAADTCNGDNCLRALKGAGSSAITFCNSYTDYQSVPTPTYVPSTCGPQRLSSACYCADNTANPTYTPAPCPTAQVLRNPSFWRYLATGNVDIRPWVISVPSGVPGCFPASGYSGIHEWEMGATPAACMVKCLPTTDMSMLIRT
jgi:hypothetical protein